MSEFAVVGVDLGKNVLHVVAMDVGGNIVKRRKYTRPQLFALFRSLPPCLVGMEACASAHYIGRTLTEMGHEARLMPAQYVKPYLRTQKNNFLDAEAICEAVQRPTMRFVPIKTREQLELQAVDRMRDRLVGRRTAVSNQIRGLLVEHGITMRQGRGGLRGVVQELLAQENTALSQAMRTLISGLWAEWQSTDAAVRNLTQELEHLAKKDPACQRLMTVPGGRPLVATAMIAAVADGSAFRRGRDFAAWLGLVPRQMSAGGKTRLGSIIKCGNTYLRRMFIHGARSFKLNGNRSAHRIGDWLDELEQ
ncbi:IS110 family transposase [Ruegeria hyattellae]|uniref:IS110 family transposase n=1 Tax=Ruegeria hyattellae TaxID=3233337 RepID=UPI00355BEB37